MPNLADIASLFDQTIRLTVSNRLSEKQLGVLVGGIARARHKELMDAGQVSKVFRRYVDGQEGVPEEDINLTQPGGGEIDYVGAGIAAAVAFCFAYCRELSPVRTGEFRNAWMVVVDGQVWQGNIEDVEGTQALITNYAPFARLLEQHVGRVHPAYHITEMAAQATKEQFGGLRISRRFVEIPGGAVGTRWPVPYRRVTSPRVTVLYPAVEIINAED